MWFFAVILLGVAVRMALWLVYEPIEYSDSGAYLRLAEAIQDLSFSSYDGSRVPGYPIFIAVLGINPSMIWITQMVMGVLTAALLFWITLKTTGSAVAGTVVGGVQAVFPGSVLFEANLLTETFTFFLIAVTLAIYVVYQKAEKLRGRIVLASLLGISASAVGLVRPIFFPLTLWVLPFVWFSAGRTLKERIIAVGFFAIFPLLLQGGWLYYMKSHYHVISPTAIGGYNMVQHAGEFFDDLPDDYATIRDVYIQYRDEQIALRGSQNNAIWQAVPALTESTGLSFYELSRELSELSWKLIRDHPVAYAVNVIEGWIWFWKAPVYWHAEVISNAILKTIMRFYVLLGRGVAVASNAAFILISAALLISRKMRDWVKIDPMLVLVGGLIGWTSIVQSIFEHGDNPRFLVPLQLFVIYFVVRTINAMLGSRVKAR
jgi:hypothetical protein